jgi:hypothetical protein
MASDFGKGLKRTSDGATADVAAPKMRKKEATSLEKWNFPKMLEISAKVEEGSQGDKFIKINEYINEEDAGKPFGTVPTKRVEIAIGRLDTDPDKHTPVRMPFDAGIPKQNGQELGTAWGGTVELNDAGVRNYAVLEKHIIDKMTPMRHELLTTQSKKAGKANFTAQRFAEEFNSKLVGANTDKGYSAYLRFHVESNPEKMMPTIRKVHRKGGKFTRPIPGTIHDLKKGCVGMFKVALSRGAYGGGTGCGLKFTLTEAMLVENEREMGGTGLDTSGMEFLDEDTPADDAAVPTNAGNGEVEDLENGSVSATLQEQFAQQ